VEGAVEQVAEELSLRLFLGSRRLVDVLPAGRFALHQALVRHDLEHLEDGGVAGLLNPIELLHHLPDRAGPAPPEHAEDGEFGIGGTREWSGGFGRHGRHYTKEFVDVNEEFRR
jgi:hypothetical protein